MIIPSPARSTLFPYTTLFRSQPHRKGFGEILVRMALRVPAPEMLDITPAGRIGPVVERVVFRRRTEQLLPAPAALQLDRKSTRLNSSHITISYAVFCLKKKSE